MPAQYDPNILQKFADKLYRRAAWLSLRMGLAFAILGGLLGLIAAAAIAASNPTANFSDGAKMICIFLALIFGIIGAAIGNHQAFALKLQAQQVLCQMEIEKNTREKQQSASVSV